MTVTYTTVRLRTDTWERISGWADMLGYKKSNFLDLLMDEAGIPTNEEIKLKRQEMAAIRNPFDKRQNDE